MNSGITQIAVKIAQIFLRVTMRPFFFAPMRYRYIRVQKPKLRGQTYIIASNHKAYLDPFAISSGLPLGQYIISKPNWFMAARKYLNKVPLGLMLKSFGSFYAQEQPGKLHGLKAARHILRNKRGNIVIFPQGRIERPNKPWRIHSGVAVLAKEFPEAKILPVFIHQRRGYGKLYNNYTLVYGEAFDGNGLSAEQIMERVFALESKVRDN